MLLAAAAMRALAMAVFLATLRDTDLLPVVQRIAAEPPASTERPS